MKDIDRNINSYLYNAANSFNVYHDVTGLVAGKELKQVYSAYANVIDNLNAADIGNTELEPGEYYYQHILNTEVSEGSCLFSVIQNDKQFPLFSYYVQTPISETKHSIIPYHFLISKKTRINIVREKPTSENFKIKSIIRIYKRG